MRQEWSFLFGVISNDHRLIYEENAIRATIYILWLFPVFSKTYR